jgi:hypothetical protein
MIYLWKENGNVVFHSSLAAAAELDGLTRQPDKVILDTEFEEAQGLLRVISNKIVVGKTAKESSDESSVNEALAEMEAIRSEIAKRDYRALKAQKLGKSIDELYAGETVWYKEQLARMEELEAIISSHTPA